MRNWPYAYALMQDPSELEGRGPLRRGAHARGPGRRARPRRSAAPSSRSTPTPSTRRRPVAVIEYLTQPEQMLERAQVVGQFPTRAPAIYDELTLAERSSIPPAQARAIIERAVPRPVTPVYTQLSEILQIQLHRALTRQTGAGDRLAPGAAIGDAGAARPGGARSRRRRVARAEPRRRRVPRGAPRAGPSRSRPSARSSSSPCFRWPGRSGSRCTCTTSGCPGWAARSSGSTTTSRRWGTARFCEALVHTLAFTVASVTLELALGLRARPRA